MATWILQHKALAHLISHGLRDARDTDSENPTFEAYSIIVDGHAEWAEMLYCGDRDIAGIAWGADPDWFEGVDSPEAAAREAFKGTP